VATFRLEIVSAERGVFADDVDALIAPGIEGQLTILPHHAPLLTQLQPGEMTVRKGGQDTVMVVSGGSAERFGKGRKVLVNTAIGVALALGAFVIVATLLWAAGARLGVGGVGWPDIQCPIQ